MTDEDRFATALENIEEELEERASWFESREGIWKLTGLNSGQNSTWRCLESLAPARVWRTIPGI